MHQWEFIIIFFLSIDSAESKFFLMNAFLNKHQEKYIKTNYKQIKTHEKSV